MNILRVLACTAILFTGTVYSKPVETYVVQGKATPVLKALAKQMTFGSEVIAVESLDKMPEAVKGKTVVGVFWNDGDKTNLTDYSRKVDKLYHVPVYDLKITDAGSETCLSRMTVYDNGMHESSIWGCGKPLILLSIPYHYTFTELPKEDLTGTVQYPLDDEPPRYLWSEAFHTWYPTKY